MKRTTGIIRRVDELGRIVLPINVRKKFGVCDQEAMEIFIDNDTIILKKIKEKCALCESHENLVTFGDKMICKKCKEKIITLHQEEKTK